MEPLLSQFCYNTGTTISGTTQVGSIAVVNKGSTVASNNSVWWSGPDETNSYIVCVPVPSNTQPTPIQGVYASISFFGTSTKSDAQFLAMMKNISGADFPSTTSGKTWLDSQGYWTNYSLTTGSIYYTASNGNDNNDGTINAPFASLTKALSVVSSGDTIYLSGGTYTYSRSDTYYQHRLDNLHNIDILNYDNQKVIFDYTGHSFGTATKYLMQINNCSNIKIKGIRLTNAEQPSTSPIIGWNAVNSDNITFENCTADHLGGVGFKLGDEGWGTGDVNTKISNNITYLNCDAYENDDPTSPTPYDGADGFGINWNTDATPKGNSWFYNVLYKNCRSFYNSDDGWDFFNYNGTGVTLENCWSFKNGYKRNGTTTGNGMGFKLGPSWTDLKNITQHTIKNCIAAGNRGNGFDQNTTNYTSKKTFYNNLAYNNSKVGYEFGYATYYPVQSAVMTFRNNISYFNTEGQIHFDTGYTDDHNTWNGVVTVNAADFADLNITGLTADRKIDGSLPDVDFGKLYSNSDLVGAGVDVGLPFSGTTPNMGVWDITISGSTGSTIVNQLLNGTFDSTSYWETGDGVSITGGKCVANMTNNWSFIIAQGLDQNANLDIKTGNTYRIKFNISDYVSGNFLVRLSNGYYLTAIDADGDYTIDMEPGSGGMQLAFMGSDTAPKLKIDNVELYIL